MRLRRVASALVLAGVLAWSARVDASPTARLVYVRGDGAEACPDEETLKQAVAARLGYDPFRPLVQNTLFAEIHRRKEGGFVANIKLVDDAGIERGARRFEESGGDCTELSATMALSISIAIDPRSALKPGSTTSKEGPGPVVTEPERPAEPEAIAPQAPVPLQLRTVPAGPAARVGVGFGVHGALGAAPSATAGVHLSAEVLWSRLSAGLELRADLPASSKTGSGTVRTGLVGAELVPCGRLAWASACAILLVGRVRAEIVDVTVPTSENFVFAAGGIRLAADVHVATGIGLRLAGDLLGTITPFVIDVNGTSVYDSPAVSGLASATLVRFF